MPVRALTGLSGAILLSATPDIFLGYPGLFRLSEICHAAISEPHTIPHNRALLQVSGLWRLSIPVGSLTSVRLFVASRESVRCERRCRLQDAQWVGTIGRVGKTTEHVTEVAEQRFRESGVPHCR